MTTHPFARASLVSVEEVHFSLVSTSLAGSCVSPTYPAAESMHECKQGMSLKSSESCRAFSSQYCHCVSMVTLQLEAALLILVTGVAGSQCVRTSMEGNTGYHSAQDYVTDKLKHLKSCAHHHRHLFSQQCPQLYRRVRLCCNNQVR